MEEEQRHTKDALRRRLRAARRSLAPDAAARLGALISRRVVALDAFGAARNLVAYAPVENEVDPGSAVATALAAGKTVYYPRRDGDGLAFVAAAPAALRPGRHGIPEPVGGAALPAGAADVVVLVPGVAFDPRGIRLGRGAGCYDRALARHPTARRIGLAYEMQIVAEVPADPWDVPMDAVVTEDRVLGPKEMQ